MMNKQSKALVVVFFIVLFVSLAATYYRTMVVRDFPVTGGSEQEY